MAERKRFDLEAELKNLTLKRFDLEAELKNLTLKRFDLEAELKNLTLKRFDLEAELKEQKCKPAVLQGSGVDWMVLHFGFIIIYVLNFYFFYGVTSIAVSEEILYAQSLF